MGFFGFFKKKEQQQNGTKKDPYILFAGPGFSLFLKPGWEIDPTVKNAFVFRKQDDKGSLRISVFAKKEKTDMERSYPARFMEGYVKDDFKLREAPPIKTFGEGSCKGALCSLVAKDDFGGPEDRFWILGFIDSHGKYALANYNCENRAKDETEIKEAEFAIVSLKLQ